MTTSNENISKVCSEFVEGVDEVVACGIVDLKTGRLKNSRHNVTYFSEAWLDMVGVATVNMFRGKMIRQMETLLTQHSGEAINNTFQEIFINSEHVFFFMKILKQHEEVVVLLTEKGITQGMGWVLLKQLIANLDNSRSA